MSFWYVLPRPYRRPRIIPNDNSNHCWQCPPQRKKNLTEVSKKNKKQIKLRILFNGKKVSYQHMITKCSFKNNWFNYGSEMTNYNPREVFIHSVYNLFINVTSGQCMYKPERIIFSHEVQTFQKMCSWRLFLKRLCKPLCFLVHTCQNTLYCKWR